MGLVEHNRFRNIHGCPPLTLDQSLTRECEAYAKVIAEKELLEGSSGEGIEYGENLCWRSKNTSLCVRDWYAECEKFDYDDPRFSKYTRHFTALIWKGAKEMGVGHAKDRHGRYWLVVRYIPPVNIEGQFEENVPRRIKRMVRAKVAVLSSNKEEKTTLIGFISIRFFYIPPYAYILQIKIDIVLQLKSFRSQIQNNI
ncbi:Golgi-associated plant pathogenesis-related protein 1 [Drosophila biarmipes]|uniref:Golgi-associated plant pathogenesis-related protein 1 n=1 Tax=Drosophila biarmipes TaxID=125945 RepID=UPI0007E7BE5A|nr:Golgi-associated plant pathogenesis-related protein 1 [Drosophila biarmipes]